MKNNIEKPTAFQVPKIWGGDRLANIFSVQTKEKLGESWIISRHSDGPSKIKDTNLNEILTKEQLPYLVKLLDTSDNLSVQVHPDDGYAKLNENSSGKTECWVILDSKPGAGIYLGLKDGITKENFSEALRKKEDLSNFLKFFPVKKYDFFFVPAGSIHAIGKDVFLAEIQQSSGITYRVWDWNRVDDQGNSRELHIDKALDVINFSSDKNTTINFRYKNVNDSEDNAIELTSFYDFDINYYQDMKQGALTTTKSERYHSLLVLEGEITLKGEDIKLGQYETALINPKHKVDFECLENTKFLHIY